jgi:short-subunit dehydrogenase
MTFKTDLKTIVIFGGTSDIARECLMQWLKSGPLTIVLVGRSKTSLDVTAADLIIRYPASKFYTVVLDFNSAAAIDLVTKEIFNRYHVDIVLVAHGSLSDQQRCSVDMQYCYNELISNGLSTCVIAEAVATEFSARDKGMLAVIGSVAGDRGRRSNYTYGAAKSMVDTYCQGLQHRLWNSNVQVSIIKPGPTYSSMTAHLARQGLKLASAEQVATTIIKGITAKKKNIYAPAKWALIMYVIRSLPSYVFNRLNI